MVLGAIYLCTNEHVPKDWRGALIRIIAKGGRWKLERKGDFDKDWTAHRLLENTVKITLKPILLENQE